MKWSDLEVGDVLRFKKETMEYYREQGEKEFYEEWCNRDLTISSIDFTDSYIRIYMGPGKFGYYDFFKIDHEGVEINMPYRNIAFEVVKIGY